MNIEPILCQYCGSHLDIISTYLFLHGFGKQQLYNDGPPFAMLPEHCTIIGQSHHEIFTGLKKMVRGGCEFNLCGCGAGAGTTCGGRVRIQNINSCAGSVKRGGLRGGCGHDSEAHAGLSNVHICN